MYKKIIKILSVNIIFIMLLSCNANNKGFHQPMTLDLKVPEGPIEYRAGWHDGCKSALAVSNQFLNSWVYKRKGGPDFGSGSFQELPGYQKGWSQGMISCVLHTATFVQYRSFKDAPLQSH